MTLLEICVDDAAGLKTAIAGGADRVELCSVLELGGLTPSPGLIALAAKTAIPVRAMIRPRAGDFVFTSDDIETMLAEIASVRDAGLEGVVLGASLPDGRLDAQTLATLCAASEGVKRTLHRAFDLVPDIDEAVELAVSLGFDTILTSGRARAAVDGLDDIARAHWAAEGRITIMAGAGINAATVGHVLDAAPLNAVHGACGVPADEASPPAKKLGFESRARKKTDLQMVQALRAALDQRNQTADGG